MNNIQKQLTKTILSRISKYLLDESEKANAIIKQGQDRPRAYVDVLNTGVFIDVEVLKKTSCEIARKAIVAVTEGIK